ncbi:PREDICTED: nodulin homeobox-like isoform X2 [Ipomoea nil]|uniref:nodulin homeobox-like isoform X2 n=1 Tax=Ipomoea nil TaxID=35883 RepID=UPI000900A624|nr:PREDICTED: nodulin homeobox-like isoform X2 [Ipomoea nil]
MVCKFHEFLQNEPTKSAVDVSSVCYAEKVAVIRRNLGSVLSHAKSLIPSLLNEEDVQLLRVFFTQLESLIAPAEIGENRVQKMGDFLHDFTSMMDQNVGTSFSSSQESQLLPSPCHRPPASRSPSSLSSRLSRRS